MDRSTSAATAWTIAAIVLVVIVLGLALWYGTSSTTTIPNTPNTGATNNTELPAVQTGGDTGSGVNY